MTPMYIFRVQQGFTTPCLSFYLSSLTSQHDYNSGTNPQGYFPSFMSTHESSIKFCIQLNLIGKEVYYSGVE
uniref:Uncharacterized protein n=1 Tax=Lepeophtheirus salmonis TaxID=72036 RepID=A0A0K2T6D6_LEPSM